MQMVYVIREYSTQHEDSGYTLGVHLGPLADAIKYAESAAVSSGIDVIRTETFNVSTRLRGSVVTLHGFYGEMIDVVQMPTVSGTEREF